MISRFFPLKKRQEKKIQQRNYSERETQLPAIQSRQNLQRNQIERERESNWCYSLCPNLLGLFICWSFQTRDSIFEKVCENYYFFLRKIKKKRKGKEILVSVRKEEDLGGK